eukprot:TRINITY_DN360_c9_g1_i1.p1 TRINITY_DN360_c9_g1~~TRINITY_DN360_c9_g1_i1.p1  ORF type:complete len:1084 (-),score=287.94 TRINITY_DN360_c9_g1_i1:89-3340(-)
MINISQNNNMFEPRPLDFLPIDENIENIFEDFLFDQNPIQLTQQSQPLQHQLQHHQHQHHQLQQLNTCTYEGKEAEKRFEEERRKEKNRSYRELCNSRCDRPSDRPGDKPYYPIEKSSSSDRSSDSSSDRSKRFVGSFGVEVVKDQVMGKVVPGSDVKIEVESKSGSIYVLDTLGLRLGKLPTYISSWLIILLLNSWVFLSSKIPKYKTNKLLVILYVHILIPTIEESIVMDVSQLNAWNALAEKLSIPIADILPQSTHSTMRISPRGRPAAAAAAAAYPYSLAAPVKRLRGEEIPIKLNFKKQKTENFAIENNINNNNFNNFGNFNNNNNNPSPFLPIESSIEHDISNDVLKTIFDSSSSEEPLRECEPSPLLKSKLHSYQKQALYWLINREAQVNQQDEAKRRLPENWVEHVSSLGKKYYFNNLTKQTTWNFPFRALEENQNSDLFNVNACGGILADQMGMGKTVEILSLILSNSNVNENSPKSTLIICPLSVLNQWESEIKKHADMDSIKLYIYHGANRDNSVEFLSDHNIVLTTYSTLAAEYPAKERNVGLLNVDWLRVVIDEAHMIKDRSTRNAKAVFSLKSERRWAVTGTPIQNKLDDMFSLLHFIRADPYSDLTWWNNTIMRPIRSKDQRGFSRLQSVLRKVLLRRVKDQKISEDSDAKIVSLPPRIVKVKKLKFSPQEEAFYQNLWNSSKSTFNKLNSEGLLMKNYAHILELLLRLRQSCDHPNLVTNANNNKNDVENFEEEVPEILSQQQSQQQKSQQQQSQQQSNASFPASSIQFLPSSQMSDLSQLKLSSAPSLFKPSFTLNSQALLSTGSSSLFKSNLLVPQTTTVDSVQLARLINDVPLAPTFTLPQSSSSSSLSSFSPLSSSSLLSPFNPSASCPTTTLSSGTCHSERSTKINALIQELHSIKQYDPTIKSIIFSQWTSMLDLIQEPLRKAGIKYLRLDGSMTHIQRQAAIDAFNKDESIDIFLISMKAGGLGLNLTAASRVFLLDPWWNPATEDQAIDRVHRIGQTKEVVVYRFIMENSVEEKILELQEKKRLLAQGALLDQVHLAGKENNRNLRLEELKILFQVDSV